MSLYDFQEKLIDSQRECERIKQEFEEFQEISRCFEQELEEKICFLESKVKKLEIDKEELQDKLGLLQKSYKENNQKLEANLNLLEKKKRKLEEDLLNAKKIITETELEIENYKGLVREKEFELEETTCFYHQTLEDFALACTELDSIKTDSAENIQRLKDQIIELNSELSNARRKSHRISQQFVFNQSAFSQIRENNFLSDSFGV